MCFGLPIEIWYYIIHNFVTGSKDWKNCTLVCREWNMMWTENERKKRIKVRRETSKCLKNTMSIMQWGVGNLLIQGLDDYRVAELVQAEAVNSSYMRNNVSVFLGGHERDMNMIFASSAYDHVPTIFLEQPVCLQDFKDLVEGRTNYAAILPPSVANQTRVVALDRVSFETEETPLEFLKYLESLGGENIFILGMDDYEHNPEIVKRMNTIVMLDHRIAALPEKAWKFYGKHFFSSETDFKEAVRKYANEKKVCVMDTKIPEMRSIYCNKCIQN